MVKKKIVTEADKVIKILNKHLKDHTWHGKYDKDNIELECKKCDDMVGEIVLYLIH